MGAVFPDFSLLFSRRNKEFFVGCLNLKPKVSPLRHRIPLLKKAKTAASPFPSTFLSFMPRVGGRLRVRVRVRVSVRVWVRVRVSVRLRVRVRVRVS